MSNTTPVPIDILDDYQSVALTMADWPPLKNRADIAVFYDHLTDEDSLAERLAPFDVFCVMRERTALRGSLIHRLPQLKFIASTGHCRGVARRREVEVSRVTKLVDGSIEIGALRRRASSSISADAIANAGVSRSPERTSGPSDKSWSTETPRSPIICSRSR